MYTIRIDAARSVVEVRLEGMMSTDEVARYIADLKRQFVQHRLRDYAMVIDVSACPIQTQDMIRAMGEHMATMPKARALGMVVGSSLARMQVRRLMTQDYARITDTLAAARAWVYDGVEPLARTATLTG